MNSSRYELLERIGLGGMAEVFRARMAGAEGFSKIVAVKRLLPNLTNSPAVIKSFVEEAQLISTLDHPNIVQVHNFEKIDDQYLLIMEYVPGHSVSQLLKVCHKRGFGIPIGLSAFIGSEAAAGLHYAHTRQDDQGHPVHIVHRDVTPQNVLISNEGLVKMTDFGIAKAASRSKLTRKGFVKGKLSYLSPEQARGEDVDLRSDIFSLGVMLYEMVMGKKLHHLKGDVEAILAVSSWRGLDASARPSHVLPVLWAMIGKALDPDPARRYQTAGELALVLRAFYHELSVQPGSAELAEFVKSLFAPAAEAAPAVEHPAETPTLQTAEPAAGRPAPSGDATAPAGIEVKTTRRSEPTVAISTSTGEHRTRHLLTLAGVLAGVLLLAGIGIRLAARDPGDDPGQPAANPPSAVPEVLDAGIPAEQVAPSPPAPAPDAGTPLEASAATPERPPAPRVRPGTLVLSSDPWAYVEINGKRLDETTPITDLKLKPGNYRVRLSNPAANRSKVITIRIRSGETTKQVVRF